jgi:hypothetical protein
MLNAIVSKKVASYTTDKRYEVIFNLKLEDNDVEVLNKDFIFRYKEAMDTKQRLGEIVKLMQTEIDLYKKSKEFITDKIVDDLVVAIKSKLII